MSVVLLSTRQRLVDCPIRRDYEGTKTKPIGEIARKLKVDTFVLFLILNMHVHSWFPILSCLEKRMQRFYWVRLFRLVNTW